MEANEARGGVPLSYLIEAIEAMDKARNALCKGGPEEFSLAMKLAAASGQIRGRISMIYPDAPVTREAA